MALPFDFSVFKFNNKDNVRYRTFYAECMANDDLLRPHVVFVTVDEACKPVEQSRFSNPDFGETTKVAWKS